jgi:hypothetical protein
MNNKIFIATPMYGGVCHGEYTSSLVSLLNLLASNGYESQYRFIYNESLITRARDTLVSNFLDTDYSHLLFIDADVIINPNDVLKLIDEDKDIICGCYPKKELNWNLIQQNVNEGIPVEYISIKSSEYVFNVLENTSPNINNVSEVKDAGTGYMLIKRSVFEKLSKVVPNYKSNILNNNSLVGAFFQTSIDEETNVLLSEDYHFCKSWRETGGKIFIAPYARAKHVGTYYYG